MPASIQSDTAAFMKEIGLEVPAGKEKGGSDASAKKKKQAMGKKAISSPSKNKQADKTIDADDGKKKNNARKWGRGAKNKRSEDAGSEEKPPEVTVSKTQMNEVTWLKNVSVPTKPVVVLTDESKWFDLTAKFDSLDVNEYRTSKENIKTIVTFAEQCFQRDASLYQKSSDSQNKKWIDDVLKSGTLSDKVASLALQVQQSPPHELEALDSLISLALKKEQRASQLAIEALKDLLIHSVLPDRRLKPMMSQPLGYPNLTPEAVSLFWFEMELIPRMERIVEAIEIGLKSTVDYFKRFCMEVVYDWMVAKPEQEGRLLSLLVNKLGDPTGKICSKSVELLGKLLKRHPAMKNVVVKEVRQLISRPNLPPRALYNCIVFLSQIKLSSKEESVSSQLVQCYVGLFEKAVTQDQLGSKLLSALLMGINRAYPYLRDKSGLVQHIDALFRIVHSSSFSTSTQALTLISHIVIGEQVSGDQVDEKKKTEDKSQQSTSTELLNRFYRAIYSKLLSDQILTRSHNTLFLNLLFRSMKRDSSALRVIAFVKRILICATQSTAPIAAGLLFLVSEVCREKPSLLEALYKIESTDSKDSKENEYWQLGNFDAAKRDAVHACSQMPSVWEVSIFSSHYHPSVQAFANSFLSAENKHKINYDGDPTSDFSLTAFLNRFAYKNPKKSQFELRRKRSQASKEEPVNSEAFLQMQQADVAPEKEFFHKFFYDRSRLREEGKSRNRSRHHEKTDEDADLSDFEEDEMDKFADKLALNLMQSAGNGPVDVDDDDFFDDDVDDDDELADKASQTDSDDGAIDIDESDDEFIEISADSSDDGSDNRVENKRKRASQKNEFASADDFEEDMEEIVSKHSKDSAVNKAYVENARGKKKKPKRK